MPRKYRKYDESLWKQKNESLQQLHDNSPKGRLSTFCGLTGEYCPKTDCSACKAYQRLEHTTDNPRAPY